MSPTRLALGLYVHIPFCSIKCYYCDFVAFSGQRGFAGRYLEALDREASLYAGLKPKTLYVGGGTPTELSAPELASLLKSLSARFGDIASKREATLEANPESVDAEKLDVLRCGGIGRLSLGLQTAEDPLLASIGRRHSFADFRRVFLAAKARGFALNVDLMIGLPGQSPADADSSLEKVLALGPDHLSIYCLQVEDRTLFAKRAVKADGDLSREMFASAIERLGSAGFVHYEISNFARPGAESAHNVNYWLNGPYIGLGCGAAGYLDGERTQNEDRLVRYLELVEAGRRPVVSAERLKGKDALGETMLLRLRLLDGFALTAEMRESFRPEIERLRRRGLVRLEGAKPRLRLSGEGRFLANEAFREFVAPWSC